MAYAGIIVMFPLLCSVSGYPYSVNVTGVKATSARLHWKTTELVVEEFLIQCVGTQFYAVARNGRVHNTEMHVRSQFVPQGLEGIRIGDLRPNYNYTCVVQETLPEGAQVMNGILSPPVSFTTDYADPAPPKAPVIVKEEGITRINIFRSPSEKFGPIHGYSVQFHVIESSFLGDVAVIDREFTDPFGKFSPASVEYAQTSRRALSFQILYSGNDIPSFVQVDSDLLHGALKNGFVYRVVNVAYTKRKDNRIAFTPSPPSDSFMAVGVDKFVSQGQYLDDMKTQQFKIWIAAGILIPLICLAYMCFIGVLLLCRERYQTASYKQPVIKPHQKNCFIRCAERLKNMLLKCAMGCATCCINFWNCFWCGWKRDKKRGVYYERLDKTTSHYHVHPQQFKPAVPDPTPDPQSSSDEISMYDKAPSMKSSTHSLKRKPSPIHHRAEPPQPYTQAESQHYAPSAQQPVYSMVNESSRKINMPSMAPPKAPSHSHNERPQTVESYTHLVQHHVPSSQKPIHSSQKSESFRMPSKAPSKAASHAPSHSHHGSSSIHRRAEPPQPVESYTHLVQVESQHYAPSSRKINMPSKAQSKASSHAPSHGNHESYNPPSSVHNPEHRATSSVQHGTQGSAQNVHPTASNHSIGKSPSLLVPSVSKHSVAKSSGHSRRSSHHAPQSTAGHSIAGHSSRGAPQSTVGHSVAGHSSNRVPLSAAGSAGHSSHRAPQSTAGRSVAGHSSHRAPQSTAGHSVAGHSSHRVPQSIMGHSVAGHSSHRAPRSTAGSSYQRPQSVAGHSTHLPRHYRPPQSVSGRSLHQSTHLSSAGRSHKSPRSTAGHSHKSSRLTAGHSHTTLRSTATHRSHNARRPTPTGYEQQLIPKLLSRQTPAEVPMTTKSSAQHTIPWTTVTVSHPSDKSEHRTSVTSPQFVQTSGTQPRYTTTGVVNTAEEFFSPNNSDAGKYADAMFLPHGYSGSSLSISQRHLKLPGNGQGYELISLSSSMAGNDSEPTPMEVIH